GMEIWKTLRVSHIPTPPAATKDKCLTRRYTNIPLGTKDRSGHGLIRTTRSTNGEIEDWTDQPSPNGTYTVDSDCTGSFFDMYGTKSENIVVFDGGKRLFVFSVAPDTIVTEEGVRLEEEKD
ncbi:MAG: hypothetical protein WA254_13390, partial [Candidatus Sulfotelmatobacter sp.]